MKNKGLSLNTIPPLFIPLRFFLTAPLFGILSALLILYHGPEIWTSRWQSGSLALTHLITIGFMLMVMIGALFQFIPVMTGRLVPGCVRLVPLIHPLLIVGALSLCSAFLVPIPVLYWLAFISLGFGLLLFALSLMRLLVSVFDNQLIVFLLRILFAVLLITIGLGLFMLLAYGIPELGISFRHYTDIHALWGMVGWVVLLIMAISSQVIPMFYVTPEFSVRYLKVLSFVIMVTIALISLLKLMTVSGSIVQVREVINIIFSCELTFFALYTLYLINHRKRKIPDVTINSFRLALISLLAAIAFWWLFKGGEQRFGFILAIILLYGLALSAIVGMLQKIVPFIIYLHLQKLSLKHPGTISLIPSMKKIITTQTSQKQFVLHLLSYLLLLASVFYTQLIWFAGTFMLLNFIWLGFSLVQSVHLFKRKQTQIQTYPELEIPSF